jgi:hypothetical protein
MTQLAAQVFQQGYYFPNYISFCEWIITFDAQSKSNFNLLIT